MENNNRDYDNNDYNYNSNNYDNDNNNSNNNDNYDDYVNNNNQDTYSNNDYSNNYSNTYSNTGTNYNKYDTYVPEENKKEGSKAFAIASMVLGILSVIMCCCIEYISIILGVLAIVFYAIDKKNNGKSNGMAIAGLVCGIVGLSLSVIGIIISVSGFLNTFEESFETDFYYFYNSSGNTNQL